MRFSRDSELSIVTWKLYRFWDLAIARKIFNDSFHMREYERPLIPSDSMLLHMQYTCYSTRCVSHSGGEPTSQTDRKNSEYFHLNAGAVQHTVRVRPDETVKVSRYVRHTWSDNSERERNLERNNRQENMTEIKSPIYTFNLLLLNK